MQKILHNVRSFMTPASMPLKFNAGEWSGAVGDLGLMLPLAFALIAFNGFPAPRIFLLWGIVYMLTGFIFRIPLAVQPLKAMSVIAIAQGFSPDFLAGTAFYYGALLLILSFSGLLRRIEKWFTQALVKGVQFGIGLLLAQKALMLSYEKGFMIHTGNHDLIFNFALMGAAFLLLFFTQKWRKVPVTLLLIILGIIAMYAGGQRIMLPQSDAPALSITPPALSGIGDMILLLIIPQLPLTLGNAVFAANDACHELWPGQAGRVTNTRLGISIGLSDMFIGLLGGFPVCHGAGGMGAHARFGARTGGSTIILGAGLIAMVLLSPDASFIFLIPVPLLAAMLLLVSWQMISMIFRLASWPQRTVAGVVGIVSLLTRNLTIALLCGLILEKGYQYFQLNYKSNPKGEQA